MSWINLKLARGRYHVTGLLGEGGMGLVYKAHDTRLGTDVVVKAPRRALVEDEEFVRRFVREIQSLVVLTHPHIVRITDVGVHAGTPFAVMQCLSGGSLEQRRPRDAQGRPLPLDREGFASWLVEVAKALDFVHAKGFVHRDVKPANVLFDENDNVYLSDFGVIKAIDPSRELATAHARTGTGLVLGTPEYLAPEIILGEAFDGRADQYSLGVMLFELLAGRFPFNAPTPTAVLVAQSTQSAPLLNEIVPDISRAVAQVVNRALSKSPWERFATCEELASTFLRELGHPPQRLPAIDATQKTNQIVRPPRRTGPRASGSLPPMPSMPPLPSTLAPGAAAADVLAPVMTEEPVIIAPPLNSGSATHSVLASWIVTPSHTPKPATKLPTNSWTWVIALAAVFAIAAGGGWLVLAASVRQSDGEIVLNWGLVPKDNVRVLLDDRPAKARELSVIPCAPGKHRLLLQRPGYHDYQTAVEVAAGGQRTISIPAWRPKARLVLQWSASDRAGGARVKIDGSRSIATQQEWLSESDRQEFALEPGTHVVQVERHGVEVFMQRVTLVEGIPFAVEYLPNLIEGVSDAENSNAQNIEINPNALLPTSVGEPPLVVTALAEPLDLMGKTDADRHSWKGKWVKIGGSVRSNQSAPAVLEIPVTPPAEYDLHLVAERIDGPDALIIGFIAGGRQLQVILDGWPDGFASGIELIDNRRADLNHTRRTGQVLPLHKEVPLVVKVRATSVHVTAADTTILAWNSADWNRCGVVEGFEVSRPDYLYLGSYATEFKVSSYFLFPPSGQEIGQISGGMSSLAFRQLDPDSPSAFIPGATATEAAP